jgi:ribose 5-phosphate isomerase A
MSLRAGKTGGVDGRSRDEMKRAAAMAAMAQVEPGMVLGVGSGTTAGFFIAALTTTRPALTTTVASSERTADLLRAGGLPVSGLDEVDGVDLYVDGADQVDPGLRLIKGGGGALTREKMVAEAARRFVCIVDETKLAARLGGIPVPIEVLPEARGLVTRLLHRRAAAAIERAGVVTDNGNLILDVTGLDFDDPARLELELDALPGVVECGVFVRRRPDVVLSGGADGSVRSLYPV